MLRSLLAFDGSHRRQLRAGRSPDALAARPLQLDAPNPAPMHDRQRPENAPHRRIAQARPALCLWRSRKGRTPISDVRHETSHTAGSLRSSIAGGTATAGLCPRLRNEQNRRGPSVSWAPAALWAAAESSWVPYWAPPRIRCRWLIIRRKNSKTARSAMPRMAPPAGFAPRIRGGTHRSSLDPIVSGFVALRKAPARPVRPTAPRWGCSRTLA